MLFFSYQKIAKVFRIPEIFSVTNAEDLRFSELLSVL